MIYIYIYIYINVSESMVVWYRYYLKKGVFTVDVKISTLIFFSSLRF